MTNTWIGTESYSNVWYYTTPTKRLDEVATYIAWGSNNGSVATNMIYQSTGAMMAANTNSYPFICEYGKFQPELHVNGGYSIHTLSVFSGDPVVWDR